MKARLILLAILILAIGFVLGMLTSAQLRLHKLKPVRVYFSEERFRDGLYKTIQPDEAQKAKIDLILDKYAKINSETQAGFRKEFDANVKALRKELDLILTKEQLARLKEMDDRRQEMIRQGRKRFRNDSSIYRYDRRPDQEREPGRNGADPRPYHRPDSGDSSDRE